MQWNRSIDVLADRVLPTKDIIAARPLPNLLIQLAAHWLHFSLNEIVHCVVVASHSYYTLQSASLAPSVHRHVRWLIIQISTLRQHVEWHVLFSFQVYFSSQVYNIRSMHLLSTWWRAEIVVKFLTMHASSSPLTSHWVALHTALSIIRQKCTIHVRKMSHRWLESYIYIH